MEFPDVININDALLERCQGEQIPFMPIYGDMEIPVMPGEQIPVMTIYGDP